MKKKCCVYVCNTNSSSGKSKDQKGDKILVYRFPEDETENEKWIKAILYANLRESKDSVVFALHWASRFQKQPLRGVLRKRGSENIQQIYRRTPMLKCDCNKVALQLN